MVWENMPLKYLRAYSLMYGQLQAEESLLMINLIALGNGCIEDKWEAKNMIKQLQYQAGMNKNRKTATINDLRAIGITIKKVKKNG